MQTEQEKIINIDKLVTRAWCNLDDKKIALTALTEAGKLINDFYRNGQENKIKSYYEEISVICEYFGMRYK